MSLSLSELVPVYCMEPAAFTKAKAVHVIVEGHLNQGDPGYFCRQSARGAGNAARRRTIVIEFSKDPLELPILSERDVDLLGELFDDINECRLLHPNRKPNPHDE